MVKVLSIGWKDFKIIFRDRAALLLMLAAPFVLSLGMGLVTGQFSGASQGGLSEISVVIVNQDNAVLGEALVSVFNSAQLAELLSPQESGDAAAARRQVDDDLVAAAVIVPPGFSASLLPDETTAEVGDPVQIEVYSNPSRPVSSGVVLAIVREFIDRVETGQVAGFVGVSQLVQNGLVSAQDAPRIGRELGRRLAGQESEDSLIRLDRTSGQAGSRPQEINYLAFLAPGMALTFLMYTVSLGGRSILAERRDGTLARLLTTPTAAAQVLGGKVFGIFLIGVAQLGILILASSLLFNLQWGDPLGVIALVLGAAAGATGWGLLLAAFAKTPGQVSSVGMAMMLMFGLLGGNLAFGLELPGWLRTLGKITPNAWGQAGFGTLAGGGNLADLSANLLALLVMAVVLFGIAVAVFRRNGFVGN